MGRKFIIIELLCKLVLIQYCVSAENSQNLKQLHVLFVVNHPHTWPWDVRVMSTFTDELNALIEEDVVVHSASTHVFNPKYGYDIEQVKQQFREYYTEQIDIIVSHKASPELNVLRETLPGKPVFVVSEGVSSNLSTIKDTNGIYIRYSDFSPFQPFNLVKQCLPKTREITIIAGTSEYSKRLTQITQQELGKKHNGININYLIGQPLAKMQEYTANLPKTHAVIFYNYQKDSLGKHYSSYKVLNTITSTSTVPIWGLNSVWLNNGIIGGYLYTPEKQGKQCARMVHSWLQDKTSVRFVNYFQDYGEYRFVWDEIDRWHINEKKLPPNSIIDNRPENFFIRNTEFIWLSLVLTIILIIISIYVLILLKHKKESIVNIKKSEERLTLALNATHASIIEIDLKNKNVFRTPKLFNYLGYSDDELPFEMAGFFSILHDDDVAIAKETYRNYLQGSNDEFYCKIRVKSKDERWVLIEFNGKVTEWNNDEEPLNMLGVARVVKDS